MIMKESHQGSCIEGGAAKMQQICEKSTEKAQEGCRKAHDKLAQVWSPGHETPCLPAGLQSHGSLSLTASYITTCDHT